jgi:hypothetical protein
LDERVSGALYPDAVARAALDRDISNCGIAGTNTEKSTPSANTDSVDHRRPASINGKIVHGDGDPLVARVGHVDDVARIRPVHRILEGLVVTVDIVGFRVGLPKG